MGFRFGFLSGFGAGYYLGTRAGQQRYDQINRTLSKARRSTVVETAAEKARALVDRDGPGTPGVLDTDVLTPDIRATDIVAGDGVAVDLLATDVDVVATDVVVTVDPDDYSSSR